MRSGAGWELRPMSISELMPMPERARRLEVFTGVGRRRNWPADEKAAIVAGGYAPGRAGGGVGGERGPGGGVGGGAPPARPPPTPVVRRAPPPPPRPAARPRAARAVFA